MQRRELTYDRESDPAPFVRDTRLPAKPHVGTPDALAVRRRNSRSFVLDHNARTIARALDDQAHDLTARTELDRVVEQVEHDLSQCSGIHHRRYRLANLGDHTHAALGREWRERGDDGIDERPEVRRRRIELHAPF